MTEIFLFHWFPPFLLNAIAEPGDNLSHWFYSLNMSLWSWYNEFLMRETCRFMMDENYLLLQSPSFFLFSLFLTGFDTFWCLFDWRLRCNISVIPISGFGSLGNVFKMANWGWITLYRSRCPTMLLSFRAIVFLAFGGSEQRISHVWYVVWTISTVGLWIWLQFNDVVPCVIRHFVAPVIVYYIMDFLVCTSYSCLTMIPHCCTCHLKSFWGVDGHL